MKTKVFYLTTRITTAVILLVILAVKAFAGDAPKVKMVPYATDKAIIAIDNSVNAVSELTIEDAAGYVLYYKEGRIDDKIYSKIFDFKNLSDGNYTIKLKNSFGEQKVNFKVTANTIEIEKDKVSFAPFLEVENDILKLSLLNHSLNNVEITLLDGNRNIFMKNLGNEFSINAGFSLARLEKGAYEVYVTNGTETFSYNFEK